MYYLLWLEGELLERERYMLFISVSPVWLVERERVGESESEEGEEMEEGWWRERENAMAWSGLEVVSPPFVSNWLRRSHVVHLHAREVEVMSSSSVPTGNQCANAQHCHHNWVPGTVCRKPDPLGKQMLFSIGFCFSPNYSCRDQNYWNLTHIKTGPSLLWFDLTDVFFLNCLVYSIPSSSFHFLTCADYGTGYQYTMYFLHSLHNLSQLLTSAFLCLFIYSFKHLSKKKKNFNGATICQILALSTEDSVMSQTLSLSISYAEALSHGTSECEWIWR